MNANILTGTEEIVFHRKKRYYQLACLGFTIAAIFSAEKLMTDTMMALTIVASVILLISILGILRIGAALVSNIPYVRLTDDALIITGLFSTKTIKWADITMINAPSDDCTGVSCLQISYGKNGKVKLAIDELITNGQRPACMIHKRWDAAQGNH